MRSDVEIRQRIDALEKSDFFGFIRGDLLQYLPFEQAKAFLKAEASEADWKQLPREESDIVEQIRSYMSFAWDKANNHRGLSAGRSLNHMQAWLWMLGEEKAAEGLEDYDHYGKPELRAICEHFGWDWTQWDDGQWSNNSSGPSYAPSEVAMVQLEWVVK